MDKERKDNLLKKGQKLMAELDEKIKFLEIAEQLLARKNQIVEVQNSISTVLDDFNKNWENDGPQALRCALKFCRNGHFIFSQFRTSLYSYDDIDDNVGDFMMVTVLRCW